MNLFSFQVDENSALNSDVSHVKVFGEHIHLFSHSYLCYGAIQAYYRYLSRLIMVSDVEYGFYLKHEQNTRQ